MSTRKGEVVLLEDFMKEAINKANEEICKRGAKKNNKLAKIIGYSAIKYSILKVGNDKNVVFDWGRALDFEGDSGPYLQYSYVRAKGILKKVKLLGKADYSLLNSPEEFELIKELNKFPAVVLDAKNKLEPHLIANYAYELAKRFSEFYHKCSCITAEKHLRNTRLSLVLAFSYVIKNCMSLIGIEAPEKM